MGLLKLFGGSDSLIYGPGDIAPGMSLVDVALTQYGVKEVGGNNRGPRVDEYIEFVGLDPDGAHPWCCAFVVWCCYQMVPALPVAKTASVRKLWEFAAEKGIVVMSPQRGDIGVRVIGPGKNHCFIVYDPYPALVRTIEGNTNAAGSREGDRVARKWRRRAYATAYIRPQLLLPSASSVAIA